jgi:AraC-like DNA-binding protein
VRAGAVVQGSLSCPFRRRAKEGGSIREEIDRCRLGKASALLAGTDESIKAISFAIGIDRPANFARFFTTHTGLSPTAYRRKHRWAHVARRQPLT